MTGPPFPIDPTIASLSVPSEPLYLQSWARVPVILPPPLAGAGPSFDHLNFVVDPPDAGCGVSYSRDASFDSVAPHVLLFTGGVVGEFKLRAIDKATGDEICSAPFAVTDAWSDTQGPPLRTVGTTANTGTVFAGAGPRRVAIVIMETTDVEPQLELEQEALKKRFTDEIFTGVTAADGVVESSAAFLAEVSGGRLTLENAGVVGTVRLPQSWNDYGPFWDTDRVLWKGRDEFSKAGVAAIVTQNRANAVDGKPPLLDLAAVDSIVFVLRSFTDISDPNPNKQRRFLWPWATQPPAGVLKFDIDGDPLTPDRQIEIVVMPDDWANSFGVPQRRVRYTVAHELCHNLGLSDQYDLDATPAPIKARVPTTWTLMGDARRFPNLSTAERRKLGWVDDGWIKTLKPAPGGGVVEEAVTLRVASQVPPGPGEHTAVEIVKTEAASYILELRSKVPGLLSDRQHTPAVFGGDWLASAEKLEVRPQLLRMRNDSDDDNGVYRAGDDYIEADTTDREYPVDLRITVLDIGPETARIRIQYGDQKPDPQITPLLPENHYQSPDILVSNDRSKAKPELTNVPWNNHPNTVTATVHNVGNLDAQTVVVKFYWADFTLSMNPDWNFIGSDYQDVPAGGKAEFRPAESWTPKSAEPGFGGIATHAHFCIKAEVNTPYHVPNVPAAVEISTENNVGQSNYGLLWPSWASPTSRETTTVAVHATPDGARQSIGVSQTSPFARTFIEHAWVDVAPGHRQDVKVYTDFMIGDETVQDYVDAHGGIEAAIATPNTLLLWTSVLTGCSASLRGGAALIVPVGQRTAFTRFFNEPSTTLVFGTLKTVSGSAVTGQVLISARPADPDQGEEVTVVVDVDINGDFSQRLGIPFSGPVEIRAHYAGNPGFAYCDSAVLVIDV